MTKLPSVITLSFVGGHIAGMLLLGASLGLAVGDVLGTVNVFAVLALGPSAAAIAGFAIGRNSNAFSAAPLRSPGRVALAGSLGAGCSLLGAVVTWVLYRALINHPSWRQVLTPMWFFATGVVLGNTYGPLFRRISKVVPALRDKDEYDSAA